MLHPVVNFDAGTEQWLEDDISGGILLLLYGSGELEFILLFRGHAARGF